MLSTVNLSDIGQTLVAFETEIGLNNTQIEFYTREIAKHQQRNEALKIAAKALMQNAAPLCTANTYNNNAIGRN